MTYEEALNRFKRKYERIKDYDDPHWEGSEYREHREWVEQLGIAIEALEKQIPKKVTDIHVDEYYCPKCGSENNKDDGCNYGDDYCPNCGQALLWGSDIECIH